MKREFAEGISQHVRHRANDHLDVFTDDEDCHSYLELLRRATARFGVEVHHYALMKTHSHMLVTPRHERGLSMAMHIVGQRYSRLFNKKHGRTGTLWHGPFESKPVTDERYGLTCARYIEQNPVRAGIATRPEEYTWSSYRVHAFGEPSDWIVPHPTCVALGSSPAERQAAFRSLCEEPLPVGELVKLRIA